MITTKADLKYYLDADRFALRRESRRPGLTDDVWKYQIALRKLEFCLNAKSASPLRKIVTAFYKYRKYSLGLKLGFDISPNVFGPGLRINHYGNIVVSAHARIGMWCDIHQGVNIGSNNSSDGAILVPVIGNNVWIGPGAKLFGDIVIGNCVQVGANAVVNKSFGDRVTIGGIPAKVLAESGTEAISVAASPQRMEKFFSEHPEYARYRPASA